MFELALKSFVGLVASVVVITVFTTKKTIEGSLESTPYLKPSLEEYEPMIVNRTQESWKDAHIRKLQDELETVVNDYEAGLLQVKNSHKQTIRELEELQQTHYDSLRVLASTRQEVSKLTSDNLELQAQLMATEVERDRYKTAMEQCEARLDEAIIIAEVAQGITRKYRLWLYVIIGANLLAFLIYFLYRRGWLRFLAPAQNNYANTNLK